MRLTSILIKIVGILLIVKVIFNTISYFTHLPVGIPYFSIWGLITCLVLACVAGAMNKMPLFIAGSVLYLLMAIIWLFIPPYEPGYPMFAYTILSIADMGIPAAGLIVLAVDAFKGGDKGSGTMAAVAVGLVGAHYLLMWLMPLFITGIGETYYFCSIPINDATLHFLIAIPAIAMYTGQGLTGVYFITRHIDSVPAGAE